jgi:hypothetical protein
MKKLSIWASKNPWKARMFIIFARIVMSGIAFFAGLWLAADEHSITTPLMRLSAGLFLVALVFYPSGRPRKSNYSARLYAGGGACIASLLFYTALGNLNAPPDRAARLSAANLVHVTTASLENGARFRAKSPTLNWKWRQKIHDKKQLLRQTLKAAKGNLSGWQIVGYTVLSLLLVAGLGTLVLFLSCELSCNGHEGAAAVVAIGGTAIIILLVIALWRWAIRRAKRVNAKSKGSPPG